MKERGNVKLEERVFVELVESCGQIAGSPKL